MKRLITWFTHRQLWHDIAELQTTVGSVLNRLHALERQVGACQVVDVHFKKPGIIVIAARVGKRDFVKIVETEREFPTMRDYREFCARIEEEFRAPVRWSDEGPGWNVFS